jgi:hypothetical protein
MKKIFASLLAMIGIIALASHVQAQGHYHLYVGAVGTNQNDSLYFDDTTLTPSDTFVSTLVYTNGGVYAGYFQPGGLTISPLAQTPANAGPVANAPALGSWIFARIVSVQGPAGGEFGFWETNATSPTFTVLSGTTNGTNIFRVGQNDGSPGSDPYGHIHGRAFTATKAGLYTIGFQVFDNSTNGVGGGPIQAPSEIYYFRWQAGLNITSFDFTNSTATATFGATGGKSLILEYKDDLNSPDWQQIGDPLDGDDHFHSITDNNATNPSRFYRIRMTTP